MAGRRGSNLIPKPNDDDLLDLMTRQELMAMTGLTEETLCRLDALGLGPPMLRFGTRAIRYPRALARQWVREQIEKNRQRINRQ